MITGILYKAIFESPVEGSKKFELDNSLSVYENRRVQKLTKFMEKHHLFGVTRKLPKIVFRFLSYLAASLIVHIKIYTFYMEKNLDWIIKGSSIRTKLKKYPPKIQKRIKKYIQFLNTKHVARGYLEDLLKVPSLPLYPGSYKDYVKFEGLDYFIEVLKKKKNDGGVIVLAAHHGNHILMAGSLSLAVKDRLGFKGSTIIQSGTITAIERFYNGCINLIELLEGSEADKRKEALYNVFRRGEFLLVFQDAGFTRYPLVSFYQELCHTALGTASLFNRFKPAVIPVFMLPEPDRIGHVLHVGKDVSDWFFSEEDIKTNPNLTKRDILFQNALQANRILEKIIKENPWNWITLFLAHEIKRYYKRFTFKAASIQKAILQQSRYFTSLLDNSYEMNRNDDAIKQVLNDLIKDLENI